MFEKILVALNSKEACAPLFETALELARATEAELMLLSILTLDSNPYPAPSYGLAYSPIDIDDSLWNIYREHYQADEAAGLRMLRQFEAQAVEAGVSTQFDQTFGNPGRLICDSAKTWNADVIVVGSHGRKGLGELLIGSVSNYVMHHAPCSVMVVHKSVTYQDDAASSDLASTAEP